MIWTGLNLGYDDDMMAKSGTTDRNQVNLRGTSKQMPEVMHFTSKLLSAVERWEAAGYTKQDLADKLECHLTAILAWLKKPPAKPTPLLKKAAKVIKVDVNSLFDGDLKFTGDIAAKPDDTDDAESAISRAEKTKRLLAKDATKKQMAEFIDYLWEKYVGQTGSP